jgi:dihydroneopterin aldolase
MEEEGKIGSDYLVNLLVKSDLKEAAQSDRLSDTIDYVLLQKIVKNEVAVRSKLLEHVGSRIIESIFKKVPLAKTVKVTVSKLNPPIGGDVEEVSVTMKSKR